MRGRFVVSMSHSHKELRITLKLLHIHIYTRLDFKRQLTLGRKWAQLRGSRRPNSYHGDDALHVRSVKFFDLSNSKRRCVPGTKRSRSDHTSLCTKPRICHGYSTRFHSTYRLYSPGYCDVPLATIKLYSFRSRFECRSRDDRSRTRARTR